MKNSESPKKQQNGRSDLQKKRAIKALVNDYGEKALPALAEIKDTTAYEEIKETYIEAIIAACALLVP